MKQFTKSCNIDSFVMRFKMRMIKCETGTDPSLNNECDQKTVCVEYGPNVDLYYDALIELSRELDNL